MDNQTVYSLEKETEIWRVGDEELLTVSIEYPLFTALGKSKINSYYVRRNKKFMALCKKRILPKIVLFECVKPVEVRMKSRVTYCGDNILSVLTDVTFSAFAETARIADIWDCKTGTPLSLSDLFPNTANVKKLIMRQVTERIAHRSEMMMCPYYPDAVKRAKRCFSADNIYIAASGEPVLFYPQNTIAPRSEGFVQFVINVK
jgi:hypothetical protein